MSNSLSIAIAGAGLLGRLLAWRLLKLGHRVCLFDKDDFHQPRSAAHTAAAMISPLSEVVVSERAIYDMGIRSLQIWPHWMAELNAAAPQPVHYAAPGSLVVAHPADMAELEQFYSDLKFHLGEDNNARWLERRDLQSLEPDIAGQFDRALYLPDEAYLDNRHLLARLLEEIQTLGGECVARKSVDFLPEAKLDYYRGPSDQAGARLVQFELEELLRGLGGAPVAADPPEGEGRPSPPATPARRPPTPSSAPSPAPSGGTPAGASPGGAELRRGALHLQRHQPEWFVAAVRRR